jgi:hypothetical protein
MNPKRMLYAVLLLALCLPTLAIAEDDHPADPAIVAARQKFFGAENVNSETGQLSDDKVILSWTTNASVALSLMGDVVLLDTYIHRLEVPPTGADTRRTPINYQDLVDLHPKAIFLGHGHGDHADNAAYIAKWLNIPIYASPETCDVMQADVARMFNDPNTANGGAKIIPNGDPVTCIPIVSRGSVPGTEVVHLTVLEPKACIIAFKHIHSGTVPRDPDFVFVPIGGGPPSLLNTSDTREPLLYPRGTCVTPVSATVAQSTCLANLASSTSLTTPVAGQVNLETTGFGNIPGSPGGAISMFYDFVLRGHNNFSVVWHNTTGPLKEGVGSDPGLPSPAVGAHLFSIMDSLPQTNVEVGAILSIGYPNNGVRDEILYQQHIKPQVYFPLHVTDVAAIGSSLEFKKTYLLALDANKIPVRPEARWWVDPDDFLRPQVFDPDQSRWFTQGKTAVVDQFCGGEAEH